MRLSKRALAAAESETLRIFTEVARLRRAGADVVGLLEGESDLPAPPSITAAVSRALRSGQTRYSSSSGLPELKNLIARKLRAHNGFGVHEAGILVTNGAKQALYEVLQSVCNPGDEVVIAAPYWVTFPETARLAGAIPVFADCLGATLDVDAIGRAITRKTKAIILNTPNNPTGSVYTRAELMALAALARRRDLILIADEAYERLVYDGREHLSIAALSRDAAARTVTIQTFSKTYSMTGFRVGYLAADPPIVRAISRLHGHMTGNVCTFAQHGAIAALKLGAGYYNSLRATFQRRRDLAFSLAAPLFPCAKPQGGYFLFVDARARLGRRFPTSSALAAHLLEKFRVAVVPGSACGAEGWLRLSFSGSEPNIRRGLARVEEALCR
ncbi:MAG: pyridoxal phosphate-dependent aminotransferase [Elusimicrobia bacterium]|nr:pyridoxal phosphate-dependent aminotransferase [Elusimicrobiota bacterium]